MENIDDTKKKVGFKNSQRLQITWEQASNEWYD